MPNHSPDTPTHDLILRVVAARRVRGRVTPQKRHRAVKAVRRLLTNAGLAVAMAEVVETRRTR